MQALRSPLPTPAPTCLQGCRAVRCSIARAYPEQRRLNGSAERDVASAGGDGPVVDEVESNLGGAIATLVFGAALLSERLNGIGIVQNLELHNKGAHPLLVGGIAGLLAAAAWPSKQLQQRPPNFVSLLQRGVGRLAYVGLAGAIAAEMYTRKGILCLLDVETGVEALSDVEAVVAFLVMIILTAPHSKLRK